MIRLLEGLVYVSFIAMLWAQALGATIASGPRVVVILLFVGCLMAEASVYREKLRRDKASENERNARLVADLAQNADMRAMMEGLSNLGKGTAGKAH
jgi:hypothetical protein